MIRLTILLLLIIILTSIVVLVPNVQAQVHSTEAPCSEGQWEKRGQCCPLDARYIAHSMCYTEEEYEQRDQKGTERLGCMLDDMAKGLLTQNQLEAAKALSCLKE